tara:strand:+ start:37 stop:642 length:606 start_codon:yes stop_codon:yes gene_type:complete
MGAIKFPHASGNSMSIAAPATNPASDLELKLPATIGTANQYLKNSGTPGTLEFGSLTTGKVLQIVQASHSSAVTDTSGSYTDTGLTASITTSSSHAGVLVIANLAVAATANNGGDAYVKFNLVRDSTQVREGMCGAFEDNLSGHTHVKYWQPAMNYYDTGTSASTSYTYKCQFKKLSDAVSAFAQNSTQGSSYILLVEIGS